MKHSKKIAVAGVLAAMSAILYIFPTFPVIPAFSWLEIDFADIPAIFASITISPLVGGAVVLVRNTVHLLVSSTAMTGELSNFLISATFVVVTGVLYRAFGKVKYRLVLSLSIAAICQIVTAMAVNYFIMIPLYSNFVNFDEIGKSVYIFAGVVPFNAIKDVVTCIVFGLVYKYARPHLAKFLK